MSRRNRSLSRIRSGSLAARPIGETVNTRSFSTPRSPSSARVSSSWSRLRRFTHITTSMSWIQSAAVSRRKAAHARSNEPTRPRNQSWASRGPSRLTVMVRIPAARAASTFLGDQAYPLVTSPQGKPSSVMALPRMKKPG